MAPHPPLLAGSLLPSPAERAPNQVFYLTGSIILAVMVARRSPTSLWALRQLSLQGWIIWLQLVVALGNIYASGILELGVGTAFSTASCSAAILMCFLAYGAFKILQLFFFTERIYLVYTSEPGVSAPRRCQSKWYRASAVLMTLWWAGGMSTLVSRFAYRSTSDTTCIIGARQYGAITVIVLQGVVNLYFTGAFLLALRSSWLCNRGGRRLAISSALAEMVGLVVSAANILGIALSKHGQESWVCLLSCGLDLFINACVAFFITSAPPTAPPPSRKGFISNFGSSLPIAPVVPLVGVGFVSSDRESGSTFTAVEEKEVAVVVETRSPASAYAREMGWEGKEKGEGERV